MTATKQIPVVLRPNQEEAFKELRSYWADGKEKALYAACPGAGKTWFAIKVAEHLFNTERFEFVIVVAPTKNIRNQWRFNLKKSNFVIPETVENAVIVDRLENNECIKEDADGLCITYQQLASQPELFEQYCKRFKTFLIGDEIHHCDEERSFGEAISPVADAASKTLALSGTPFNTRGGVISMCELSDPFLDENDMPVRKAISFAEYSYGQALSEKVCRVINFRTVIGKSKTVYESLLDKKEFSRVVDLAKRNKTDRITKLLDIDGDFLKTMISEGVSALNHMRKKDHRAAMLIVAKDRLHAKEIKKYLVQEYPNFNTMVIVHDSANATERLKQINTDNTDILVAVRMVSEGVDIPRLRVGVYATHWLTRLFFIQFAAPGRFGRWQKNLPDTQYAVVVIPAHIDLITWAREIMKMITESVLPLGDGGPGPPPPGPTMIEIENSTSSDAKGGVIEAKEITEFDINLIEKFRLNFNVDADDGEILKILRAGNFNLDNVRSDDGVSELPKSNKKSLREKNEKIVRDIAIHYRNIDPKYQENGRAFAYVNRCANEAVGIRKVDSLTPIEKLKERLQYLRKWRVQLAEETFREFYNG